MKFLQDFLGLIYTPHRKTILNGFQVSPSDSNNM